MTPAAAAAAAGLPHCSPKTAAAAAAGVRRCTRQSAAAAAAASGGRQQGCRCSLRTADAAGACRQSDNVHCLPRQPGMRHCGKNRQERTEGMGRGITSAARRAEESKEPRYGLGTNMSFTTGARPHRLRTRKMMVQNAAGQSPVPDRRGGPRVPASPCTRLPLSKTNGRFKKGLISRSDQLAREGRNTIPVNERTGLPAIRRHDVLRIGDATSW